MPSRGKLARRIVVFEWSYDRVGRAEDFCYAREDGVVRVGVPTGAMATIWRSISTEVGLHPVAAGADYMLRPHF